MKTTESQAQVTVTTYECEVCGFKCDTKEAVERCELLHLQKDCQHEFTYDDYGFYNYETYKPHFERVCNKCKLKQAMMMEDVSFTGELIKKCWELMDGRVRTY